MKRSFVFALAVTGVGAALLAGCTTSQTASTGTSSTGSLAFPKDKYTVATQTVGTTEGTKTVTYHYYKHVTYVTNPVDEDYESMDVKVPVEIDGKEVDASDAPILFDITVGGYMSAKNTAESGSSGGMGGGPRGGGAPNGQPPAGFKPPEGAEPPGGATGGPGTGGNPGAGNGMSAGMGDTADNANLALAAGYVVVVPGCRGRDATDTAGTYNGKAPAAIVDLKAAVRYIRYNKGVLPGNPEWIVSTGSSAGGALSALLGASGDSLLYDEALKKIGAAEASDTIFASADYCPITDLEHADGAYEWMFGSTKVGTSTVDQTVSKDLAGQFAKYQASLGLNGENGFGAVTAKNYSDYLMKTYLVPAATTYLAGLSDAERSAYLAENSWMKWTGGKAVFSWADYIAHIGRMKGAPAFDTFDLSSAESIEFGTESTNARHFTLYSLQHEKGTSAQLDSDLPTKLNQMNPMYFLGQKNAGAAKNWWIRYGTSDTNTSLPVIANLALAAQNAGLNVNSLMYWDAGHGANQDADDFIKWIGTTTGYSK